MMFNIGGNMRQLGTFKNILIVFYVFLLNGCTNRPSAVSTKSADTSLSNSLIAVDTSNDSVRTDTTQIINFTDKNGLMQGRWITRWKGKIIEISNYTNDTLNGYYISFRFGGGNEGNYIKGKREGFFYNWYVYRKKMLSENYYHNDSVVWMGFPSADENCLIPVTGFIIWKDSTYIQAVYENGEKWYEGHFCLRPSAMNGGRLLTYAYGIHKIYYRNGKIKGIVDYKNEIIQKFDSVGKQLYKAKFSEYDIHKQTVPLY